MGMDYFLGLDMGTGSLGWAVTDPEYEIVKKHGKALWGGEDYLIVHPPRKNEECFEPIEED